jgi:hypothetical protein
MTALAKNIEPLRRGDFVRKIRTLPVKGNVHIYHGATLVLNGGYLAPATTATGLIAVGVAEQEVDNTGGADGALTCRLQQGEYVRENSSAGDAIAQADVGADCYLVDDQTVAKTSNSGARSRAGKITEIQADGRPVVQLGIGV